MATIDAETKLQAVKQIVEDWVGKQSHEHCWYYPDLFRQLCQVLDVPAVDAGLPPRAEFERGCQMFQEEIFENKETK